MAVPGIPFLPPEPFPFTTPNEWPLWRKRFERYRYVSGLHAKSEEEQVHALIYSMGPQAEAVLLATKISEADQKKYDNVIAALEAHFIVRRNVIYERAKFHTRIQEEGETVESFVTALHTLAEHCEFEALREGLIRDRLVVGLRDSRLSERLQLDNELTLEKAVTAARQSESVKQQQDALRGNFTLAKTPNIDRLESKPAKWTQKKESPKGKPQLHRYDRNKSLTQRECGWCGKGQHTRNDCPAKIAVCRNCSKKGHYAGVCRSKTVREVSGNAQNGFLGTIVGNKTMLQEEEHTHLDTIKGDRAKRWTARIDTANISLLFKIDTGADVTVISNQDYQSYFSDKKLLPPEMQLYTPKRTPLGSIGMIRLPLKYRNQHTTEDVYIIEGLETPLLSLRASEELNLVRRVNQMETENRNTCTGTVDPMKEFPQIFTGLGKMNPPHKIQLKQNAQPYAAAVPRRIPLPLMKRTKLKLEEMVLKGVIEPVNEPSDWCAPAVIIPKRDSDQGIKDIRICVDLTELNKNVEREFHTMPVVEHTLGQLSGAKYMSKLDANSGFWQIGLTEDSKPLTTFITPFGRYRFTRVPFGISSAPEHFQKRMSDILSDLPGVVCQMDDILVWGETQKVHDALLRKVLQRLQDKGVTLNPEKCQFSVQKLKFLGHIIDGEGIHIDEDKIEAITKYSPPKTVSELRRFLGLTNFMGRFIPNLSNVLQPLTELLKSRNHWTWDHPQEQAFKRVKELLTSSAGLAIFDPNKPTTISADASSFGLGATLTQKQEDGQTRPVAYASKTLTEAEKRYAQIEKEALALVWACDRFRDYITGITVALETDHKPLVPILTKKQLDDLTPRLQRLRIRLMRYSFTITHTPGKDLVVADALSRCPLQNTGDGDLQEEVSAYVQLITGHLPASDGKIQEIWEAQQKDETCQKLAQYSLQGWPEKKKIDSRLRGFWHVRHDIAQQEGLLMRGSRLIIPIEMQEEIKLKIHEGHQGITKCRARARESVWWPGLSTEITDLIRKCPVCIKEMKNRREPLIPADFPDRPWQRAAMDLLYIQGTWYLVVTDYYSRYFELAQLSDLKAQSVIEKIKPIFGRHGIPEEVRSDNGPQFDLTRTSEFSKFAREYGFVHTTSSPKFAQSNGAAEAAVKIIKMLRKKSADVYKALLAYRNTPLANGFSPAELSMGRRLRTTLPVATTQLQPFTPERNLLRQKEEENRVRQKKDYDRRHGVRELPQLTVGQQVWVIDQRTTGTVIARAQTPRSYFIQTSTGRIRRNRYHLIPAPTVGPQQHPEEDDEGPVIFAGEAERREDEQRPLPEPGPQERQSPHRYQTRCGRTIQPHRNLTCDPIPREKAARKEREMLDSASLEDEERGAGEPRRGERETMAGNRLVM